MYMYVLAPNKSYIVRSHSLTHLATKNVGGKIFVSQS